MNDSNIKIESEPGLKLNQDKQQVDFYVNGFLLIPCNDKNSLKNLLTFLSNEITKFNSGDRSKWKQTFGGAYDMVDDEMFIDFIKKNNLLEIVNSVSNQEYVLGDIKLRMWCPGDGYLNFHRDTYINKKGKIIGKIPPDINVFFYPKLFYKKGKQLYLIEKSHRRDFDNFLIKFLMRFFEKRKVIYSNDDQIVIFNSSILHGLPKYNNFLPTRIKSLINKITDPKLKKKKFYPRLIIRFCAVKNREIYNRGTDLNNIPLPSLSRLKN